MTHLQVGYLQLPESKWLQIPQILSASHNQYIPLSPYSPMFSEELDLFFQSYSYIIVHPGLSACGLIGL